ncbi:MAG: ribosome biogenesis GTP-binding protein YihA/YsxC [Caldimicrobium sp.]|jgi:GTP-binding protein
MFKRVEFLKSVYKLEDLPLPEYPEIAILGRSNAGKSSFINAFLNQKKLAKVSSTPGFTQSLNFFLVDRKFYLVDLPGYGYAKVPKEVYKNWQILIEGYLKSPRDFCLLFLIFDIRREPDELDQTLLKFISYLNMPYALLLNKIDMLSKREIEIHKEKFIKSLKIPKNREIFLISCKEKKGFEPIRAFLKKVLKLSI